MFKAFVAIGLLLLNFGIMLAVTLFAPSPEEDEEKQEWKYSVDDERLE